MLSIEKIILIEGMNIRDRNEALNESDTKDILQLVHYFLNHRIVFQRSDWSMDTQVLIRGIINS